MRGRKGGQTDREKMKILIFTENIAGHGHTKAACYLQKALERVAPGCDVRVVSVIPMVSPFIEKSIRTLYHQIVQRVPEFWGIVYKREGRRLPEGLKNFLEKVTYETLCGYIKKERPAVVVCTHAFALETLGRLRRKEGIPFRLVAVPTDFSVHPFWVGEHADRYFVASAETKREMVSRYGVAAERIEVTGIPVDYRFHELGGNGPETVKRKLGLEADRPVVLLAGGGMGLGPIDEIFRSFDKLKASVQILAVTGHNAKLYAKLEKGSARVPHPTRLFRYVNNMHELLYVADCLVSKPGGLTCAEALAAGTPLVIYKPIPGQETKNTRLLTGNRLAYEAQSLSDLLTTVDALLADPKELARLKRRLKEAGRPEAALAAARKIRELAGD
ncbi:glycosyltransferase [Bacillaceae bacterium]